MKIRFFETYCPLATFGEDEEFLQTINANVVPREGELVLFENLPESYRVIDVSYCYGDDGEDPMTDILIANNECFEEDDDDDEDDDDCEFCRNGDPRILS